MAPLAEGRNLPARGRIARRENAAGEFLPRLGDPYFFRQILTEENDGAGAENNGQKEISRLGEEKEKRAKDFREDAEKLDLIMPAVADDALRIKKFAPVKRHVQERRFVTAVFVRQTENVGVAPAFCGQDTGLAQPRNPSWDTVRAEKLAARQPDRNQREAHDEERAKVEKGVVHSVER